jgi:GTP-binding protein
MHAKRDSRFETGQGEKTRPERPVQPCSTDLPIVAIVGRPNVGKSTLFNRLVRGRIAIVDDEPGVTRDRNYRETHWAGKRFFVVDTGGLVPRSTDTIETLVRKQVEVAIEEAAVVVFVVDGQTGVTPLDSEVADIVRKTGKPRVLAVNKTDARKARAQAPEFYELGLGDFIEISAEHGRNVGELLDAVAGFLPSVGGEEEHVTAIAVVGKPNVGKSSLINRLTGKETMIVDHAPGTTRDAVDTYVNTKYGTVRLVDTAGLRKKSKTGSDLEKYANIRSMKAVDRSEVTVLMVDSESGLTRQDLTIAGYVERSGKAMVVAWNKWDLHKDTEREAYIRTVMERFRHQPYLPVVFTSCLTGEGVDALLDMCFQVYAGWDTRLPTGVLNRGLESKIKQRPPGGKGGRFPKIYYASQTGTRPPTFTLFVNDPALIGDSYRRFLEKQIRALYPFRGTPVRIRVRKSQ